MGRRMDKKTMLALDSEYHPLLEPQAVQYSNLTVRRAYIVWLRCGQNNQFKDVCNYYHWLEQLENELPEYTRAISRHHEFSLMITDPPTSPYQMSLYPNLYSAPHQPIYNTITYNQVNMQSQCDLYSVQTPRPLFNRKTSKPFLPPKAEVGLLSKVSHEEIFEASQVFKTPEEPLVNGITSAKLDIRAVKFPDMSKAINKLGNDHKMTDDLKKNLIKESTTDKCNSEYDHEQEKKEVPEKDILKTIQLVHNYCKELVIPIKDFWKNFNDYASKCELSNSVYNVSHYVNNKMVESELPMALFQLKVKIHKKEMKMQIKEEIVANRTAVNKTQDSPSSSYKTQDSPSSSYEQEEEDILPDPYTDIKKEKMRKMNEFNVDLISFVDKITREQEEKIKQFFEEASNSLSNVTDIEHDYTLLKCRKI